MFESRSIAWHGACILLDHFIGMDGLDGFVSQLNMQRCISKVISSSTPRYP